VGKPYKIRAFPCGDGGDLQPYSIAVKRKIRKKRKKI
jgi:hypothetical protein